MSKDIEAQLAELAEKHNISIGDVAEVAAEIADKMGAIRDEFRPTAQAALSARLAARDNLLQAVTAAPDLFDKKRSRNIGETKYGYRKGQGKVVVINTGYAVKVLGEQLPAEQFSACVSRTPKILLAGCRQVPAGILAKAGVQLIESVDAPFVTANSDPLASLESLCKGWRE